MSKIEIRVPQLPESVEDATVISWYKKIGDTVLQDENLLDLETDKVALEVPAPANGVLVEIAAEENTTVLSGELLGVMEETALDPAPAIIKKPEKTRPEEPGAQAQPPETAPEPEPAAAPDTGNTPTPEKTAEQSTHLSPSVRKIIAESGVDPSAIKGTGKHGRITPEDVMAVVESRPVFSQKEAIAAPAPASKRDERAPMTRIRQRIAERLIEAQQNAAILTTFNDVDMSAVMNLRKRYRDEFEEKHGVRLGFMSFFVKAAVAALKQFPIVNATIDGSDVVYHHYFDIGIAVASPRGLVVPVIHGADQSGFADIEKQISAFGHKAKTGSLTIEDLTGGTFSITNGGVFGSLLSTPILNPPQSAILGLHRIDQRPIARDGEIVIAPMMYMALSYDHRLIDGKEAVQFLGVIKENIQNPEKLLLQL